MTFLNRRQLAVVFLLYVSTPEPADTEVTVPPNDVEAFLGTSATFNCSSSISGTDIQWNIYPVGKVMEVVYAFDKINSKYANRFTVQNGVNLHISSVTMDDAGTYECADDFGEGDKKSAELILIVTDPSCQSNSNLNKILGNNTWGVEPSQVTLSCSVQFQGKKAPTLEWKKSGEEKAITSGVRSEIQGNRVLHNLTMKGDSIANGSSYNCRPAKATSGTMTCNSGTITIVGESATTCQYESCKSYIVAIICIFVILCFGLTSLNVILWCRLAKVRKQMKTRNEAEEENILLPDEKDEMIAMKKPIADLEVENLSITELKEVVKDLESHLFPKEKIDYAKDASQPREIETKKVNPIKGLAVLENELFVLHEKCSEIEVYDTETCQYKAKLQIPGIKEPFDLTGWRNDHAAEKCLFTVGMPKTTVTGQTKPKETESAKMETENEGSVIVGFDLNGELLKPWPVKSGSSEKCRLSAHGSSLIVMPFKELFIREFSGDGQLIREVDLASFGSIFKLHCSKITNFHIAISYTEPQYGKPTIIVIGLDANVKNNHTINSFDAREVKKYTMNQGSEPYYFIVDKEGSFLVADKKKGCISLFSSTLNYCKNLIELKHKAEEPTRLCFDEEQSSLFVAATKQNENKPSTPVVQIYKVRD